MNAFEFILIAGWILWLALYFHLAWNNGKVSGLNYSIMFFPFFLFIKENWREEIENDRKRLQFFALVLLVATVIAVIV